VVAAEALPPFYFVSVLGDDGEVSHRRLVYAVRGADGFESFVVEL